MEHCSSVVCLWASPISTAISSISQSQMSLVFRGPDICVLLLQSMKSPLPWLPWSAIQIGYKTAIIQVSINMYVELLTCRVFSCYLGNVLLPKIVCFITDELHCIISVTTSPPKVFLKGTTPWFVRPSRKLEGYIYKKIFSLRFS